MTFLQRWGELAGGIRGESVRRGEGVALVHLISTITRMALLVCTQKLGESGGMLPQEIFLEFDAATFSGGKKLKLQS